MKCSSFDVFFLKGKSCVQVSDSETVAVLILASTACRTVTLGALWVQSPSRQSAAPRLGCAARMTPWLAPGASRSRFAGAHTSCQRLIFLVMLSGGFVLLVSFIPFLSLV